MNRRQRRAARASGGEEFPPGYVEQIEAMSKIIVEWLRSHPTARPVFFMPPPGAWIIVDLPSVLDRVAGNAVETVASSKAPTLLMLRIALKQAGYPETCVPLEVFTAGYDPVPTQPGGKA